MEVSDREYEKKQKTSSKVKVSKLEKKLATNRSQKGFWLIQIDDESEPSHGKGFINRGHRYVFLNKGRPEAAQGKNVL